LGFLAATGSPPFSLFISEFGLIQAAVKGDHWWVAGLFLTFLVLIFIGFSSTVVTALYGTTDAPEPDKRFADSAWTTVSPLLGLVFVLLLGLWTPPPLRNLFNEAMHDAAVPKKPSVSIPHENLLPPTSATSAQVNP
jgi:hydrogenase-4 component F